MFKIPFCFSTGNVNVALQVWDIGGQTLGGAMIENYVYGAHVSLFFNALDRCFSFMITDRCFIFMIILKS